MSAYENPAGEPWPQDDGWPLRPAPTPDDGSHTPPHGDTLFVPGDPLVPDDQREVELDEEAYR